MLVPLTSSLFIPGRMQDAGNVMVDIGTGYYLEKNLDEARDYLEKKMTGVTQNTDSLEV